MLTSYSITCKTIFEYKIWRIDTLSWSKTVFAVDEANQFLISLLEAAIHDSKKATNNQAILLPNP
jgi:hypothetical protein